MHICKVFFETLYHLCAFYGALMLIYHILKFVCVDVLHYE